MGGADSDQQWPPRSPYEALLSSPSGRSRARRDQDRTSPSPSPFKTTVLSPSPGQLKRRVANQALHSEEEDDDEDEETLRLRLQALEAKLKLKQLRQKKNKAVPGDPDVENQRPRNPEPPSRFETTAGAAGEGAWLKLGKAPRLTKGARPVQVPASPPRKNVPVELPKSPGRVLLGIDKGLKGKNVSLRKPPVVKSSHHESDDPFLEDVLRHRASRQQPTPYGSSRHREALVSKPIGFSERIANIRQEDKDRRERTRKLETQRSTGFGIVKEELDRLKTLADEEVKVEAASGPRSSAKPSFSRRETLQATSKADRGLAHGATGRNARDKVIIRRKEFNNPNAAPGFVKSSKPPSRSSSVSPPPIKNKSTPSRKATSPDDSLFEPFSSFHLTKRLIPHDSLTKALSGKSILLLPDALGTVKAPEYCFRDDLEADVVILAAIASKSNPLSHKDAHKTIDKASTKEDSRSSLTEAAESEANAKGKYMALTLTDLKWTLDLYLFTTAFTRFRKITPGTVVAILNPAIMPPPPHNPHNNRFSLTLSSSDDTILEIGTSRDLGWCSSVKRDGKQCDAWIDMRHTSFCEFHVDTQVEKTRRGRMEVNGMSVPFAPGGKKGGRTGYWGGGEMNSKHMPGRNYENYCSGGGGGHNLVPEGRQYDRINKTTFYVGAAPTGAFGQSAASLLDGDELAERGAKEERTRKRLAERERETEIARRLGERGNDMGGEYLKIRHENPSTAERVSSTQGGTVSQEAREPVDAVALGLKGNKAVDVQLSPLRKKRRLAGAMEEGGRKKTRFLTEGGIKEAGRESLGVAADQKPTEEDDDLDIV
ncbi:MAG: hypothetical protein LQ339_007622 [Xanthoria mediterranea]|nr:MAG: hypothetical protein LQ339_007622 [Xanthoria mediterranea]